MELYQLRYFEAVVRLGSLTTAAAACHVSQPSLSAQLKNLEAELGVRLVDRQARGVIPTPAGERLLLTARRLRRAADGGRRHRRRRNFAQPPESRLGLSPLLAAVVLPRPLAQFLAGRDNLRITVRELPHLQLTEALTSHALDLALITQSQPLPVTTEARPLFRLAYGIVCAREHPLTKIKQPRLRDLLPYRVSLYQDPAGFADRLTQLGTEVGQPPRIVFHSDQALTVFEMASAGLGVAVLPTLFRERAQRHRLAMLPLYDRNLSFPVVAVWNRSLPVSPGLESLIRACQDWGPAT